MHISYKNQIEVGISELKYHMHYTLVTSYKLVTNLLTEVLHG
jgi:hypothetical protein